MWYILLYILGMILFFPFAYARDKKELGKSEAVSTASFLSLFFPIGILIILFEVTFTKIANVIDKFI